MCYCEYAPRVSSATLLFILKSNFCWFCDFHMFKIIDTVRRPTCVCFVGNWKRDFSRFKFKMFNSVIDVHITAQLRLSARQKFAIWKFWKIWIWKTADLEMNNYRQFLYSAVVWNDEKMNLHCRKSDFKFLNYLLCWRFRFRDLQSAWKWLYRSLHIYQLS